MRASLLIIPFLCLTYSPSIAQTQTLSESRSVAIIDKLTPISPPGLLPQGTMSILAHLGAELIRKSEANADKTLLDIGEPMFKMIQAGQAIGLLSITQDEAFRRYKAGDFNFITLEEIGRGLVDRVVVKVTDTGRGLLDSDGWTLTIPKGSSTATKILRTEYRQIGIDTYAIVFFTYLANWNPIYVKFYKTWRGTTLEADQKGIILVKYDLFSNDWQLVPDGVDIANATEDFEYNQVQRLLMQLSAGTK